MGIYGLKGLSESFEGKIYGLSKGVEPSLNVRSTGTGLPSGEAVLGKILGNTPKKTTLDLKGKGTSIESKVFGKTTSQSNTFGFEQMLGKHKTGNSGFEKMLGKHKTGNSGFEKMLFGNKGSQPRVDMFSRNLTAAQKAAADAERAKAEEFLRTKGGGSRYGATPEEVAAFQREEQMKRRFDEPRDKWGKIKKTAGILLFNEPASYDEYQHRKEMQKLKYQAAQERAKYAGQATPSYSGQYPAQYPMLIQPPRQRRVLLGIDPYTGQKVYKTVPVRQQSIAMTLPQQGYPGYPQGGFQGLGLTGPHPSEPYVSPNDKLTQTILQMKSAAGAALPGRSYEEAQYKVQSGLAITGGGPSSLVRAANVPMNDFRSRVIQSVGSQKDQELLQAAQPTGYPQEQSINNDLQQDVVPQRQAPQGTVYSPYSKKPVTYVRGKYRKAGQY